MLLTGGCCIPVVDFNKVSVFMVVISSGDVYLSLLVPVALTVTGHVFVCFPEDNM